MGNARKGEREVGLGLGWVGLGWVELGWVKRNYPIHL